MEAGTPAATARPASASGPPPGAKTHPTLTWPQILSFAAFVIFVALALVAEPDAGATVSNAELREVATFTMFLIGAMLPSDALIRFGRNLLFQNVDKPDTKAKDAPATTLAQWLAFGAFVVVVLATLLAKISGDEFREVIEVARVLVVALLPSDAGIRFGRALYYRSPNTPAPGAAQLRRV
ncbi:MAG: hypothetical protein QOG94_2272 [Solirubrobacteraceae bacterium]|jgi:hypothetical protein|nr:hypothetical protein [Solirubrobacteraceae bacterium]MEA2137393.1 hypothetical protein [Solirubrobacteraceae bacterium]